MPRHSDPVLEVYGCKKCSFIYESPIRLQEPPIHHCPSPKSLRTSSGVLLDTFYEEEGE